MEDTLTTPPPPEEEAEGLLTVREVAARGMVSRKTVYRAARAGHLRAVWLGPQTLRFRPDDVDRWMNRDNRG